MTPFAGVMGDSPPESLSSGGCEPPDSTALTMNLPTVASNNNNNNNNNKTLDDVIPMNVGQDDPLMG